MEGGACKVIWALCPWMGERLSNIILSMLLLQGYALALGSMGWVFQMTGQIFSRIHFKNQMAQIVRG